MSLETSVQRQAKGWWRGSWGQRTAFGGDAFLGSKAAVFEQVELRIAQQLCNCSDGARQN